MPTITLTEPWTFHSIEKTIDFPAGTFEVTEDVAKAAPKPAAPPTAKEPANGDRTAKTGTQEAANDTQGE